MRTLARTALDLARALGVDLPTTRLRLFGDGAGPPPAATSRPPAPPSPPSPDALGAAYERLVAPIARKAGGVHYTPPAIADGVVAITIDGLGRPLATCRVCDPAAGGGAFLLAAARAMAAAGADPRTVVEHHLFGLDVDPLAVAVAETALALWSGGAVAGEHLAVGDALGREPAALAGLSGSAPFDIVVGNPPFQGQLQRSTARTRADAARLAGAFGVAASGYADTAALFLVAATHAVADGGRVGLIQPDSVLAARDAGGARAAVLERCRLAGLWVAGEAVFGASVRVCAPVLERTDRDVGRVRLWRGRSFQAVPDRGSRVAPSGASSWAPLAAEAAGVPSTRAAPATCRDGGRLGDVARATAGFRDEYYGLAPALREAAGAYEGAPRVVTVGALDPGTCHWGRRPARIAGARWEAPVADLALATERARRWSLALLVPKVVVATQTRVVEAAVDRDGSWVPAVPVVAVLAEPDRLSHVAAALLAPPVSAWAMAAFGGAALTSDALKLSARQVLDVPLPCDPGAWDEGAATLAAVEAAADETAWLDAVLALGRVMSRAYGEAPDGDVFEWWSRRLPRWTRTRRGSGLRTVGAV